MTAMRKLNGFKEQILALGNLERNWDGYDSPSIKQENIDMAFNFVDKFGLFGTMHFCCPISGGAIQLEFCDKGDKTRITAFIDVDHKDVIEMDYEFNKRTNYKAKS